jgi:hypothetical protein
MPSCVLTQAESDLSARSRDGAMASGVPGITSVMYVERALHGVSLMLHAVEAQQDLGDRMTEDMLARNPVGERLVRFPTEDLQDLGDSS